DVLVEFDASQHGTVGHAGRREQTVAANHVLDLEAFARIGDAHLGRALAPLVGVEHEPALHLAADAAQRRRRQYALGRAADPHIDVDSGRVRLGGIDDSGDVAVGDETHRGTRLAYARDQVGAARAVENE